MKEQRNNGRKRVAAVVSIVAGAALLLGGGTYALWSQTASVSGGTITAGDLNLAASAVAAYDVSLDRTDSAAVTVGSNPLTFNGGQAAAAYARVDAGQVLQGHSVNLATWRIVPGDTVAVAMPFTVTLVGDNLVAALTIDDTNLVEGVANTGMTYYYAVFDQAGAQVGDTLPVGTAVDDALPVAYFQANGTGQAAGVDDTIAGVPVTPVGASGTVSITLVVFGYFDSNTADRTDVSAADVLGDLVGTLTQVRAGTDQFGS